MEGLAIIVLAWAIGLWALLMWVAGSVAQARGRTFGNWAMLAFAYGIIAVIAAAVLPPLRR